MPEDTAQPIETTNAGQPEGQTAGAAPAAEDDDDDNNPVLARIQASIDASNGVEPATPAPKLSKPQAEAPKPQAKPEPKAEEKAEEAPKGPAPLKGDAMQNAIRVLEHVGFTPKAVTRMDAQDVEKHARRAAIDVLRAEGTYHPDELKELETKPLGLLLWKGAKAAKQAAEWNRLNGLRGGQKQGTINHGTTQQGRNPARGGNAPADGGQPRGDEPDGLDDIEDIDLLPEASRKRLAEMMRPKKAETEPANPDVHPHTVELRQRFWAESLSAVEDEFPDVGTHYRAVMTAANDLGLTDETILDADEPTRIKLVRRAAESLGLVPVTKPTPETSPRPRPDDGIPRPGGPKAPPKPMTEEEEENARITAVTRGKTSSERQAIFRQLTGR